MINVKNVFDRVSELSRKGQSGAFTSADFNKMQRLVQDTLFAYYYSRFEETQSVPDSMAAFIINADLTPVNGIIAYPGDYRDHVELSVKLAHNGNGCKTPTETIHLARYYASNEQAASLESSVRAPSYEKRRFYFAIAEDGIHFFPKTFSGKVHVKYFTQPAEAVYATTFDATNDVENYDSANSVDFAWYAQDEINLVDLFLFYRGVETRQSELIKWTMEKKNFTSQIY